MLFFFAADWWKNKDTDSQKGLRLQGNTTILSAFVDTNVLWFPQNLNLVAKTRKTATWVPSTKRPAQFEKLSNSKESARIEKIWILRGWLHLYVSEKDLDPLPNGATWERPGLLCHLLHPIFGHQISNIICSYWKHTRKIFVRVWILQLLVFWTWFFSFPRSTRCPEKGILEKPILVKAKHAVFCESVFQTCDLHSVFLQCFFFWLWIDQPHGEWCCTMPWQNEVSCNFVPKCEMDSADAVLGLINEVQTTSATCFYLLDQHVPHYCSVVQRKTRF